MVLNVYVKETARCLHHRHDTVLTQPLGCTAVLQAVSFTNHSRITLYCTVQYLLSSQKLPLEWLHKIHLSLT